MRPLHFLLVEDDPDQAERVRRSIQRQPVEHRVTEVADGAAALAHLRDALSERAAALPDLVLLDLELPGRHGLDVLREIKEDARLRGLPVIVLTSSRAEADVDRAYDHHVNSYVVKPIEYARLAELIEGVATYWGEWNRPPDLDRAGNDR